MASITITKALTSLDKKDIVSIYNSQGGRDLSIYSREISDLFVQTFEDVKIAAVARIDDLEANDHGFLTITLDPEHPMTEVVREWIGEGYGITMEPSGRIRTVLAVPYWRVQGRGYGGYMALLGEDYATTHSYYSPMAYSPNVDAQVGPADVGAFPINLKGVRNPEAPASEPNLILCRNGSAQITIWPKNRPSFCHGGYSQDTGPKDGTDFWTWLDLRHRYDGFGGAGDIDATIKAGSEIKFRAAMGIPSNENDIHAIRMKRVEEVGRRGRVRLLDVFDEGEALHKGSVAKFPTTLQAPAPVDYITTSEQRGYRRSNRRVHNEADGDVRPLLFGLSPCHEAYRSADAQDMCETWPLLAKFDKRRQSGFWSLPYDRLLVFRSSIGWHGMFTLGGMAKPHEGQDNVTRPEIPVCYMIPVFMAFGDLRDKPDIRFRRFSAEERAAIAGSFGLADFLTQALLTLKGAKAKMARCGLALDNLPCKAKGRYFAIPDGHLIRTWGEGKSTWVYDCAPQKYGVPITSRAVRVAHRAVNTFAGAGHVDFYADAQETTTPIPVEEEPVQRVAPTRRMLEL